MACSSYLLQRISSFFLILFTLISTSPGQEQESGTTTQAVADTSLGVSSGTIYGYTSRQIQRFPFRDVQSYLELMPGVVRQDGSLYVRGNRKNDLGYSLNGTAVTNRFTGLEGVHVIPEAIARIDLHTGLALPSDGFANAGVVHTLMKTGGEEFAINATYLTDDFAKPGQEFLKTSSFGFRTAVLTAGGPMPFIDELRFFVAGEHRYMRNRQPMFLTPFFFNLKNRYWQGSGYVESDLPAPISFSSNYVPNSWIESNTVQGNVTYNWEPLTFQFTGSYQNESRTQGGEWPSALFRFFNQKRTPTLEDKTAFLQLHATHNVSDDFSYNLTIAHQRYDGETLDPDFGSDWRSFTDSTKNAQLGYTGFRYHWQGPDPYYVIDYFLVNHPNTPNNRYTRSSQHAWTFSGNASYAPTENISVKFGGNVERWTMRLFDLKNIQGVMTYLYGYSGSTPMVFDSAMQRRVAVGKVGAINHFGYDVDGKIADDGFDEPRKPLFASAYAQGVFHYENAIVELGLRLEHYSIGQKSLDSVSWNDFDRYLDVIDETKLREMPTSTLLLPRIGLSYPVSASTVLFGSIGQTAQLPPLNLIYAGNTYISRTVSETSRGNAFLPPYTTSLKPERTTHTELGLRKLLLHGLVLNAAVFYKSIRDQLAYARCGANNDGFTTWKNSDEATIKGIEILLAVQRASGFSASLAYTLSAAEGTGSNPKSRSGRAEQGLPEEFIVSPLDFNQRHRATLVLDYLMPQEHHAVLGGFGFNLVLNYNSGHNYTKLEPIRFLGSTTPWDIGVWDLRDPRFAFPAEPINSSTTPAVFNVDVTVSKAFRFGSIGVEVFANVLNLFNTKHVLNVYARTGNPQDDGWLSSRLASYVTGAENYEAFYRAINLDNRWAYMSATGYDLYGTPRQIRFGLNVNY